MNIDLGLLPLAKRTARDPSAIGLVAANLVAAAIAVLYPPITMSLMFLYWAECVVIGLFNIAKLYHVPPLNRGELDRKKTSARYWRLDQSFTAAIFVVHFGGAVFGCWALLHALALWELRKPGMENFDAPAYYRSFIFPVAVLVAVHGYSFFANFLGKREYIGRSGENQMFRPYGRVIFIVLLAFFGAPILVLTHSPEAVVGIFLALKLYFDLRVHFRDHDAVQVAAVAVPRRK